VAVAAVAAARVAEEEAGSPPAWLPEEARARAAWTVRLAAAKAKQGRLAVVKPA